MKISLSHSTLFALAIMACAAFAAKIPVCECKTCNRFDLRPGDQVGVQVFGNKWSPATFIGHFRADQVYVAYDTNSKPFGSIDRRYCKEGSKGNIRLTTELNRMSGLYKNKWKMESNDYYRDGVDKSLAEERQNDDDLTAQFDKRSASLRSLARIKHYMETQFELKSEIVFIKGEWKLNDLHFSKYRDWSFFDFCSRRDNTSYMKKYISVWKKINGDAAEIATEDKNRISKLSEERFDELMRVMIIAHVETSDLVATDDENKVTSIRLTYKTFATGDRSSELSVKND